MFDYLIVGAGFAGSVLAERLATQESASVLIIDKRNHIAGNAYDYYDDAGTSSTPTRSRCLNTSRASPHGDPMSTAC
jgi:choline dehydrogenase-like flavoprotein